MKRSMRIEVDNPQSLKHARTTDASKKVSTTVLAPLTLVVALRLPSANLAQEQVHASPNGLEVNRIVVISSEETTFDAERLVKERRVASKKRKAI